MGKYIRGDVTLAGLHLKKLPEIFKDLTIEGNLFLNDNRLTTLENFPELVTGNIQFGSNPLVSLKLYQHYLSMLVNLVIWKDVRHTLIN